MAKGKMPPELLEHFKKKEAKNEDGSEMSDKEKRKAALDKARSTKNKKVKRRQSNGRRISTTFNGGQTNERRVLYKVCSEQATEKLNASTAER